MDTPMREFLDVSDVMRILKVSRRTIYYWIQDGILQPFRAGRGYRFRPEDIESLANKAHSGIPSKKKRILAIDDDMLVRESLRMLLARFNYAVTLAGSGQEALDLVTRSPAFDLIVTDVRMPGMNGIETLKEIRQRLEQNHLPEIPEVIITAYSDRAVLKEAKDLSVCGFFFKPFDIAKFVDFLNQIVSDPVKAKREFLTKTESFFSPQ